LQFNHKGLLVLLANEMCTKFLEADRQAVRNSNRYVSVRF
jgi:hypothetical protein